MVLINPNAPLTREQAIAKLEAKVVRTRSELSGVRKQLSRILLLYGKMMGVYGKSSSEKKSLRRQALLKQIKGKSPRVGEPGEDDRFDGVAMGGDEALPDDNNSNIGFSEDSAPLQPEGRC